MTRNKYQQPIKRCTAIAVLSTVPDDTLSAPPSMRSLSESISHFGPGIIHTSVWIAVWESTSVVLFRPISERVQFGVRNGTVLGLGLSLHYCIEQNLSLTGCYL